MTSPRNIAGRRLPKIPDGDIVATFPSYEQAHAAIDTLVRNEGLSIEQISIVGSDLKSIERVTGRMNYGRAALNGLGSGVMIGLFLSLMWLIFFPETDFVSLAGIFVMSVAFGVIWALIGYAISPQKSEFTSIMQVTASRFDLVVPREISAQVRDTLSRSVGGVGGVSAPRQDYGSQPTQYGAPGSSSVPGSAPYGQQPSQQQAPGQYGQAPIGQGAVGQPPVGQAAVDASGQPGAGAPASEQQPAAPAQPPRTYGEMQDELRRREREAAAGNADPETKQE